MRLSNMAGSLAACLQTVGFEMPCVSDVVPLLDVDGVVDALTGRLTCVGLGSVYCPRVAPSQGVVSCTYEQWFRPFSPCRRYCQLPVSGGRMQRFLQFRLDFVPCQLPQAVWLVLTMYTGLTGFVWLATAGLLVMKST